MQTALIVMWLVFLGFIAWEFVMAKQLPEKYSRLQPGRIRLIDTAIAVLIVLTIWQLAVN